MLHDKAVLISGASGALGSIVTREFAQTQARLALRVCAREQPPGICPICKVKRERFERFW